MSYVWPLLWLLLLLPGAAPECDPEDPDVVIQIGPVIIHGG